MRISTKLTLTAGAVALMACGMATGTAKAQDSLTKGDVEQIIQDYIMENPKLILDAVEKHRENMEKEQKAKTAEKLAEYSELFEGDKFPSVGPADAGVTVVEFFDYNCGYCKRALPDVQALIDEVDDVRVVFIEMPILGPTSRTAAEWAMAAYKQDKYFEYHAALMDFRGPKNEETLSKLAADIGLDVEQMKSDVQSEDVQNLLNESIAVARDIGITGTPAFIVNGELFSGYLGEDGLKRAVQDAR